MRYAVSIISTLWMACMLLFTGPAQGEQYSCTAQPYLTIVAPNAMQVKTICDAGSRALEVLDRYGLQPKRQITFEVIDKVIENHGYSAYGSYDSRDDRIRLMSLVSILLSSAEPKMYGEPFDRVHYLGAIAHEVAHAVVQHNLPAPLLSAAPQEYLAHSVQLAVLPEARRSAIIHAINISPWESGDAISEIYMALEPGRFAVKSYLHLTSCDDPIGFVHTLLNAKWFYVSVP